MTLEEAIRRLTAKGLWLMCFDDGWQVFGVASDDMPIPKSERFPRWQQAFARGSGEPPF